MSGTVREAFLSLGHNVYSVDLLDSEVKSDRHLIGDIFSFINYEAWDMLIAFPPCIYLCKAQMWMCNRWIDRMKKQDEAVSFVRRLIELPIKRIAIENPPGALTNKFRVPEQTIYPWQFGDPYTKPISLWLKNLDKLIPRFEDKPKKLRNVSNHVNSRMSQAQKSLIKSSWKYFPGLANDMALQWGYH
jgi:hypothetical protein